MKHAAADLNAAYRRRSFWLAVGVALAAGWLPAGTGAYSQEAAEKTTRVTSNQKSQNEQAAPAPPKRAGVQTQRQDRRKGGSPAPDSQGDQGAAPRPPIGPGPRVIKPGDLSIVPAAGGVRPAPPPGSDTARPGRSDSLFGKKGTPFSFDFRGSDIDNVLKLFSQASGMTIAKDPTLTGQVTIINPKQVTLDEAFKVLQSVLWVRGYSAVQKGNVLTIAALKDAIKTTQILNTDPSDPNKVDPRDQVMTQVIPLENVDADSLAKELQGLISTGANLIGSPETNSLVLTDTAGNVQRFIGLVDALDKASNKTELKIYPLKRAEASIIADMINNIYSKSGSGARPGGPQFPGQPPQPVPGGVPGQTGVRKPPVQALADTRTNSVLVVASQENQERIATDIIGRLDDDESNTLDTQIRKIKYADATTIANQVNQVLSNMHASPASGSSGNSSFYTRMFNTGSTGGDSSGTTQSSDPLGKVTADPRTNSVLITASPERMEKILQLIDRLDVFIPAETTTFVVPLKRANAQDVTAALGQAFGGNNNNGYTTNYINNFGGRGGNNNNNRRQPVNRRTNNSSVTGRSGRMAVPPGPPNPPDGDQQDPAAAGGPGGIPGVMTSNGFVPADNGDRQPAEESDTGTNKRTRQFPYDSGGFYGGGRYRGQGQGSAPQYGRDRQGNYVNLLQLYRNVNVTPSPGGDSIIVTTTPDNFEAVKKIIDELDVVQRQVMIEVIIAEVTLDSNQKLGWNLNATLQRLFRANNTLKGTINLPATDFGPVFSQNATGLQATITGVNYNSLVQALQSDSKIKVLSTPRIFTSNNQLGSINITRNIPYITSQDSGVFGGTTVSNTVQYLPVGFTLEVTPRITPDGQVTIEMFQSATDLLSFRTLGTGASALVAPEYNERQTDTVVTVQDAETVVIGGLIRESQTLNVDKVPVLSEIPLLGQFFRSRQKLRNNVELMVFLTPHVVSSVDEARQLTLKEGKGVIEQMPNITKQQPNLNMRNLKPEQPDAGVPGTEQSKSAPRPATGRKPDLRRKPTTGERPSVSPADSGSPALPPKRD